MMIHVRDLPDQLGSAPRAILYCPACGSEFSAHRGDYFMANPNTVMRCSLGHAPRLLRLVTKRTVYQEVS